MYKVSHLANASGAMVSGNDKDRQGYIQDLTKLSRIELLDLKQRQEQLLRNKSRVAKLPDKGAKIERFYEQIVKQLQAQDDIDRAAEMFSDLNIASVGKKSLARMEWNGNRNGAADQQEVIDSDDDPDEQPDVLKILAQSTATEKKIILAKPEPKLITEQDLKDIKELQSGVDNDLLVGHVAHLCQNERNDPQKDKFLPFRTTTSNVHQPEKERQRQLQHAKTWDNTAATPPALVHVPAKLMSLEESVLLQVKQTKLLEQVKQEHAQERLRLRGQIRQQVSDTLRNDTMSPPPLGRKVGFNVHRGGGSGSEEGEEEEDEDDEQTSGDENAFDNVLDE